MITRYYPKHLSLLLILLLAIILGSFGFYLIETPKLQIQDLYFCVVLALISIGLVFGYKTEDQKWSKKTLFGCAFALIFFVLLRLLKLDEQSLWYDEYVQYFFLKRAHEKSIISGVFLDGHPPLDYLFQNLIIKTFGTSIFTLRIHAIIWSIFSFCYCLIIGRQYRCSPTIALIACCFFFSHPYIFAYQVEGRIYSMALFAGLFAIHCHKKNYKRIDIRGLSLILSANLIIFFTVSLQSVVFISLLSLFSFSLTKNWRYLLANLISFLFLAPLLYFFFLGEDAYILDVLSSVKNLDPTFSEFIKHIKYLIFSAPLWWGGLTLLMIFGLKKSSQAKNALKILFALVIFIVINLLIFSYLFKLPLFSRYLLLGFTFIPFILFILYQEYRPKFTSTLPIFLVLLIYNVHLYTNPIGSYSPELTRAPWKEAFQILNKLDSESSAAVFLNINDPSWMRVRNIVGFDFYANKKLKEIGLENKKWPDGSEFPIFINPNFNHCTILKDGLYIIYQKDMNHQRINLKNLNANDHKILLDDPQLQVRKIKSKGSYYRTYKAYFEDILNTFGINAATSSIVESYAVLEFLFGNDNKHLLLLEALKNIPNGGSLLKQRIRVIETEFIKQNDKRNICD